MCIRDRPYPLDGPGLLYIYCWLIPGVAIASGMHLSLVCRSQQGEACACFCWLTVGLGSDKCWQHLLPQCRNPASLDSASTSLASCQRQKEVICSILSSRHIGKRSHGCDSVEPFLPAAPATAVVRLSHRNSACLFFHSSVCPSVTRVDQSKMVQARITKSSSLAAWKTLVLGSVEVFHKFERGNPKRGC